MCDVVSDMWRAMCEQQRLEDMRHGCVRHSLKQPRRGWETAMGLWQLWSLVV